MDTRFLCSVVSVIATVMACSPTDAERARLARLSSADLATTADDNLESKAFSPIVDAMYAREGRELSVFKSLSPGQRALYATWHVEGEVNNGGFNQYFYNSDGHYADAAASGYDLFGATELAAFVREATRIYQTDSVRIQKAKDQGTMEAFMKSYDSDPYETLDKRFCAIAPPGAARVRYIRTHPSEFVR